VDGRHAANAPNGNELQARFLLDNLRDEFSVRGKDPRNRFGNAESSKCIATLKNRPSQVQANKPKTIDVLAFSPARHVSIANREIQIAKHCSSVRRKVRA
jgi:hypothetical protein